MQFGAVCVTNVALILMTLFGHLTLNNKPSKVWKRYNNVSTVFSSN